MIESRHTFLGKLVAEYYSGYKLKQAFPRIHIIDETEKNDLPVLLISNHFCWWDGFIQYRFNKIHLKRKIHIMMLEEQLKRYKILNQCGAFSVRKGSKQVLESIQYCLELLKDNRNMVIIFPQGKIQTSHTTEFVFESGVDHILKRVPNDIHLIFNINLVDYFSYRTPSLTIYTKTYNYQAHPNKSLQQAFNSFAEECRIKQRENN